MEYTEATKLYEGAWYDFFLPKKIVVGYEQKAQPTQGSTKNSYFPYFLLK